jgi:hypothetical protein
MELFTFAGDWSPYVAMPALGNFRLTYNRQAPEASPARLVQLQIEDQQTSDPDPFPAQLAAIDYLLQHEREIADILLTAVFNEYPEFWWWDITVKEGYPSLQSPELLRTMFEITSIEIKIEQREGLAYTVLNGTCSWFENSGYGLGILMHKGRVIRVCETSDFCREIEEDGGYFFAKGVSQEPETLPSLTRLYMYDPHPKYGTLKPWQQRNNYEYPYNLISKRQNEDFIVEVELGLLSVDHVGGEVRDSAEYRGMTLLEYACRCENEELIRFLLSRKPASVKNCIQHVSGSRELILLLLDAGADINEVHRNLPYATALAQQTRVLIENKRDQKKKAAIEGMIQWLIAQGADPYVKNDRGTNAFSVANWLSDRTAGKLITFLENSFKDFHPGRA